MGTGARGEEGLGEGEGFGDAVSAVVVAGLDDAGWEKVVGAGVRGVGRACSMLRDARARVVAPGWDEFSPGGGGGGGSLGRGGGRGKGGGGR